MKGSLFYYYYLFSYLATLACVIYKLVNMECEEKEQISKLETA